eukprot:CAMPEP_0178925814 /NCGR_PEP_ID=MMETSP0786-20121207/18143_1 /TAXON_ID=186022 /ORGANISM="Thalassionema frauenfeldii, Strain CCMP 1798" /LENGTH=142 /DNA_ID=CAMNT_0020600781 /DNA_START=15 /DNA_END=439 /DNA_ORIENTATION=+
MPHRTESHTLPSDSNAFPFGFVPPPHPTEHRQSTEENERRLSHHARRRATNETRASSSITANDILCGRGALSIHHPGNQYFRSLVKARQQEYAALSRQDKSTIVREILQAIESRNGRFLRQMGSGEWVEVHDAISYEKTCQA